MKQVSGLVVCLGWLAALCEDSQICERNEKNSDENQHQRDQR